MRKIYKQNRLKVNTVWSHDDIIKLIAAVKECPTLWDISSSQYKLPKRPAWQEISDVMGDKTADECKAKWANLRVTFKTNLRRSQGQNSDSDAGGSIVWKYFNAMMFLDVNTKSQAGESFLSMTQQPGEDSNSTVEESKPPLLEQPIPPIQPSQLSSSSNSDVLIKEIAAKVISTIAEKTNTNDQFDAFGAYVAAELRSLPLQKGLLAKRKLAHALMDVMDEA